MNWIIGIISAVLGTICGLIAKQMFWLAMHTDRYPLPALSAVTAVCAAGWVMYLVYLSVKIQTKGRIIVSLLKSFPYTTLAAFCTFIASQMLFVAYHPERYPLIGTEIAAGTCAAGWAILLGVMVVRNIFTRQNLSNIRVVVGKISNALKKKRILPWEDDETKYDHADPAFWDHAAEDLTPNAVRSWIEDQPFLVEESILKGGTSKIDAAWWQNILRRKQPWEEKDDLIPASVVPSSPMADTATNQTTAQDDEPPPLPEENEDGEKEKEVITEPPFPLIPIPEILLLQESERILEYPVEKAGETPTKPSDVEKDEAVINRVEEPLPVVFDEITGATANPPQEETGNDAQPVTVPLAPETLAEKEKTSEPPPIPVEALQEKIPLAVLAEAYGRKTGKHLPVLEPLSVEKPTPDSGNGNPGGSYQQLLSQDEIADLDIQIPDPPPEED